MPSFGNLFASLTLESASFMSGMKAAQKELAATQKKFASVGANLTKVGAVMTVGLTAPFLAMSTAAMEGAQAQRQAMAQVNAALASMGPVAGRTADQLEKTADALEMRSMVDADIILTKVTANLLTFGNVAGQVFDRAQQAALDMAQRMGGDVQSAAMLVGKALNAPVQGLSALTRVGIQFTAAQKQQIAAMVEAGNVAGAQGIILGELERQFGGAAAAAANTDPYRQMNVALGQMADVLGEVMLDVIPPITSAIKAMAEVFLKLPQPVQTGVVAVLAFSAALGPVVLVLGSLVSAVGAALPFLAPFAAGLLGLAAAEGTAATATFALGGAVAAIAAPIAAAIGAIALVVAAVRHWDEITEIARRLYTGVKTWLMDKLGAVITWVAQKVTGLIEPFRLLWDKVVGHSYIPDMVDAIGDHMARLDGNMVAPVRAATSAAEQAFSALGQRVAPILDRLFPDQAKANQFRADMADLRAFAEQAGWSQAERAEAMQRLRNEYGGMAPDRVQGGGISEPGTPGAMTEADMQRLAQSVEDATGRVKAANDDMRASWADTMRDALGSVRGFANAIRGGDILGAIQSVLDLIGQVAGLIRGTGTPAVRTYSTGGLAGARANGGPVLPNRSYLVGERGPEILRMGGSGGSIVPNDQIGGPSIVEVRVVANDFFDAKVAQVSGGVSAEQIGGYGRAQRRAQRGRLG